MRQKRDLGKIYPTARKHCARCGSWRPISDFGLDSRGYLVSWCRTCIRLDSRVRIARLNGREEPYGQQRYVTSYAKAENDRRNGRRRWRRATPEERADTLARKRMATILREERETGHLRKARFSDVTEAEKLDTLPAGPFQEWLRALKEKEGSYEAVGDLTGLQRRRVEELCKGYYQKNDVTYEVKNVEVDTVDKALVNEGRTGLWELYPHLYE